MAKKHEDLAKIAASIRADTVKARAHVLQKLLEAEDTKEMVQLSYAVSSLEKTALAIEEAARKRETVEKGKLAQTDVITVRFMDSKECE